MIMMKYPLAVPYILEKKLRPPFEISFLKGDYPLYGFIDYLLVFSCFTE